MMRTRTVARVRCLSRLFATVLVPCAIGCRAGDAPDAPDATFLVEDSAGVEIVESARPVEGSRVGWRIGPEPAVTIGVRDGDEPYMLYLPSSSFRFPDGRIVVANRGTEEVRVFDRFGTHLTTLGGEGGGPGEFGSLMDVAPWPGDSIVAWDSRDHGISVFDSGGDYGRTFFLQSGADHPRNGPKPVAARLDGTVLSVDELRYGAHGMDPAGPVTADSARVEIWDGAGERLADLGNQPGEEVSLVTHPRGGGAEYVADAYSGEFVVAAWGDLVVAGPNKPYEIRAFRGDGRLARIVRLEHEPRSPAEADQRIYVDRVTGVGNIEPRTGPPIPEAVLDLRRQFFESVPLAEHFPAFSTILADDTGHLWVREYDYPQEEGSAPIWTVFDPNGRVLGYVETPAGLQIQQIGEDYILGHTEDELGVEYVQVWPLERAGG